MAGFAGYGAVMVVVRFGQSLIDGRSRLAGPGLTGQDRGEGASLVASSAVGRAATIRVDWTAPDRRRCRGGRRGCRFAGSGAKQEELELRSRRDGG